MRTSKILSTALVALVALSTNVVAVAAESDGGSKSVSKPQLTAEQIACMTEKGFTKRKPGGTKPTREEHEKMRAAAQACGIALKRDEKQRDGAGSGSQQQGRERGRYGSSRQGSQQVEQGARRGAESGARP